MNFQRMTSLEDLKWKRAWAIYQSNFPEGERRFLIDQKRMLLDERYFCTAVLEQEVVVGILFYWKIEQFFFVEHLAIDETCKGKGIGTLILEKLKEFSGRVILEIDPPDDDVSIRRKEFYERAGFILNPYQHLNLPIRIGQEGLPLCVMTIDEPLSEGEYRVFNKILMTDLIQYGEGYRDE